MNFFLRPLYLLFIWSYICFLFFSFRSMNSVSVDKGKWILTHISDSYYSLIWYLGAGNIKLTIIESYCLWVDIRGINCSKTISSIFLLVGKIKVTLHLVGFLNSEDIHCKNSTLIMTNVKRKVRLGVDKRILGFCKFISDTVLYNTALSTAIFPLQPAEYKQVL